MKIENLKIYSGNIYGLELSRQLPLITNCPAEYHYYTSEQITKLARYNQDYFVSIQRIFNQAFFVGYEEGIVREILTGHTLPVRNIKNSVNDRYALENFYTDSVIKTVHVNDLREELDITRVEAYINGTKLEQIKQKIEEETQRIANINELYLRQHAYKEENKEKVKELAMKIQNTWNNN